MVTDHYVEDERSVVMVEESVLGLSPVATAILEAVPDGATVPFDQLVDHLVRTFGEPYGPESAEAITRQQVHDLVAHRVLVVEEDVPTVPDEVAVRTGAQARAEAVDAARDALRHLRTGGPTTWSAPGDVSPSTFVAAARQHHVVSYLAAHLDRLDLPGQARAEIEAMAGRQRAGATLLAADLSVAVDVLSAAGVRALVFKGVALAAQAYGDFTIRGAGDLDLLVPPSDLVRAHRALTRAGWRPGAGYPTPGPSWAWRHFVRTGNELPMAGDLSEIDLHWHLVPTRGTFPDFDTLWERRELVSVGDGVVPTLTRYDALAHTAGHAAKDEWRWLRSLLDVHALTADRDTWERADRPLRRDQQVSVGLAALLFGIPATAPEVVDLAMRRLDAPLLDRVRRTQEQTDARHRPLPVPGMNFLHRLSGTRLTGGSLSEAWRLLSRSALPPWVTAEETSPSAAAALPRALGRRAREVVVKSAPARPLRRRTDD